MFPFREYMKKLNNSKLALKINYNENKVFTDIYHTKILDFQFEKQFTKTIFCICQAQGRVFKSLHLLILETSLNVSVDDFESKHSMTFSFLHPLKYNCQLESKTHTDPSL